LYLNYFVRVFSTLKYFKILAFMARSSSAEGGLDILVITLAGKFTYLEVIIIVVYYELIQAQKVDCYHFGR